MKLNTTVGSFARSIALGLVFLLVLEICARLDDWIKWNAPLLGTYSRESLILLDSIGLRNRPNAQYEKWKINSFGFRGDEIQKEIPDGVTRLMVIGASEAFGLYEAPGKEFPAQLHNRLNQTHPGQFEVINGAVPGLSPPRILHLYDKWLAGFKPHIVVYYPSLSGYLMRNPPETFRYDHIERDVAQGFELRLLGKASTAIKRFLPISIQTALKEKLIEYEIEKHPPGWVFYNLPFDRPKLFNDQLDELVKRIQKDGTHVILCTHAIGITDPYSAEGKVLLAGWRKLYPYVSEAAFLEMERIGNQIIRRVAENNKTGLIDIDSNLQKTNRNFADHVHFTTDGAAEMAHLMHGTILQYLKHNTSIVANEGDGYPKSIDLPMVNQ